MNNKRKGKSIGLYFIVLIILMGTIGALWDFAPEERLIYSEVLELFETEQVKAFVITGTELQMQLQNDEVLAYELPSVGIFLQDMGELITEQRQAGIIAEQDYVVQNTSWIAAFLPYIIIIVVFGAFWFYMINRQEGGTRSAMNFGKSRAKMAAPGTQKVTFADVAGADEEKGDLEEVVEFLKDPKKFMALGARIPKGVLLVGPPGTGKTLIAKAVAGEAGVPFFSISGSDFVELYVGVGASRVRDLFEQAKKNAPAIVFIDEIDAVGRQRGAGLGGGHDEREQTLNQLLVEMDGFGNNAGVIIIAATNRADILDPALQRPGRFDRQIYIGVPDIKGRKAILNVHSKKKPFEESVNFETIARSTVGFTGADLENLLNEAALLAARRNKSKIGNREIDDAFLKVIMGNEKKSRVISEHERNITAYHEAGHAITARLLPTQDPVQQVSIIPRGRAGGFTLNMPKEDKYYMSKNEMLDELVVLLGGRVAEALVLGDISTGASNDIERASALARKMVTKYGMSEKLGPISFGSAHDEVFLGRDFATSKNISDGTASVIDAEVESMIHDAYKRCQQLIEENRETLDRVAAFLLERETMDADEFEAVFLNQEVPPRPDKEEAPAQSENEQPTETEVETVSTEVGGEVPLNPPSKDDPS